MNDTKTGLFVYLNVNWLLFLFKLIDISKQQPFLFYWQTSSGMGYSD